MSAPSDPRGFWVWFDPLLEDHFCIEQTDEHAEQILATIREAKMTPRLAHAQGRKEALEQAFPNWQDRAVSSPRLN